MLRHEIMPQLMNATVPTALQLYRQYQTQIVPGVFVSWMTASGVSAREMLSHMLQWQSWLDSTSGDTMQTVDQQHQVAAVAVQDLPIAAAEEPATISSQGHMESSRQQIIHQLTPNAIMEPAGINTSGFSNPSQGQTRPFSDTITEKMRIKPDYLAGTTQQVRHSAGDMPAELDQFSKWFNPGVSVATVDNGMQVSSGS